MENMHTDVRLQSVEEVLLFVCCVNIADSVQFSSQASSPKNILTITKIDF